MLSLIFASHNSHKLAEAHNILPKNINIVSLKDLDYHDEIEETGSTFAENALIKAKAIALHFNKITIADDSGLEVDYLNGAPGVYSARYAGKDSSSLALCTKLIQELAGIATDKRTCRFVTNLALVDPLKKLEVVFEGTVDGVITEKMLGTNGFGYDPVFYYPPLAKSMAEMSSAEKNAISHRYKALLKLRDYLGEVV